MCTVELALKGLGVLLHSPLHRKGTLIDGFCPFINPRLCHANEPQEGRNSCPWLPLRSSRVPAPRTSAEPTDKFLSDSSQILAGDHLQIIGDPIGAVEVKVLTSQTHTYRLCRVINKEN